ncbi:hypothetical protein OIU77_006588 [Salix suchowensis]|uniref:Uncharacterized protein n=1 Tax=Salix suchowensis TaxID=1278906 RepID=A0ABQ9AL72_9ROSI|nr:hypothetical protein OIU77_006588 [Salix suchowensis]
MLDSCKNCASIIDLQNLDVLTHQGKLEASISKVNANCTVVIRDDYNLRTFPKEACIFPSQFSTMAWSFH